MTKNLNFVVEHGSCSEIKEENWDILSTFVQNMETIKMATGSLENVHTLEQVNRCRHEKV